MTTMTAFFRSLSLALSLRRSRRIAASLFAVGSMAMAAGTFTATGSMSTPRYWATGTVLPNGKVLVAGGSTTTTGPYTATAELYDPATGTFSATGSLATPRGYHSQVLLPTGKVLLAGGTNSGTLNSAELYDPATGTFSATGSMVSSRYLASMTLLPNGKVLVAGGYSSTSGYLSACEIYDPATGAFTSTGSMVNARRNQVATLLPSGKVLVAGGYNGTSAELMSAELYDPAAGTWSTTGSMASVRRAFSGTLLPSGKALITDGYNGTSSLSACELYDPSTGNWTATGSTASTRNYHTTTLLQSGKVLVYSGAYGELYDPSTGTFAPQIHAVATRSQHVSVLLPNGKVLIAGGVSGTTVFSSAEVFDPQASADPSLMPSAAITAPVSATAGAAGLTASVPATAGASYAWSISGGTITGGQGTNVLTFTAGSTGTLTLNALVTSALGIDALGTASVSVVASPNATISATSPVSSGATGLVASVPIQGGASYAWTLSGGTITAGQWTNQITYTVTAAAGGTVTLGCAVTNGGLTANGSKSVFVSTSGTGAFTATGSLAAARFWALGTMLPNGKVLVAGGESSVTPAVYLASAEVYDPAAGTWATTGSMGTARAGHGLALLSNGKVLVAGGTNGSYQNSAELYDPITGAWSATGSMVAARWFGTMTALPSGKVLMAGGYNSSGGNLASCELYDPATGTWSATGSLNTARRLHSAVLLANGKVLVIGGYGATELASAEIYDPATGTWSTTGSMASVRRAFSAALLPNGKVLVADGYNGSSSLTASELYDPTTGTFSATGASGSARTYDSATLLPSGKALIYGLTYGEVYDPATGTYGSLIHAVTNRNEHVAVLLPSGKVLIAGGVNGTTVYAAAELFDPQAAADPSLVPSAAITAPVSVTAGTAGLTASLPSTAGATYEWTISGGTITGGQGTNVLAFTAGSAGTLTLSALVTSALGVDALGTASVSVVASPNATITAPASVTSTIAGQTASVPAQSGASYAWTISGGTITSAATGNSITFTPGAPGTLILECTVTNAAGAVLVGTASAQVVLLPDATITAPATITLGVPGQTASVQTQAGCTYAWSITPGSQTGTVTGPTPANASAMTYTAGGTQSGLTLTCTVTNAIGYAVTGTKAVTIVPAPVITLFSAAKADLNPGDSTTLTVSYSGGTGTLDQGLGAVGASAQVTVTPVATTSYTLSVVNAAGTITTAATTVQVVPAPIATITAPSAISLGSVGVLASVPAQTGSTYAWTITGGSLISGAASDTAFFTPSATGTLTLQVTVTNAAGRAATGSQTVSVVNGPTITQFTAGTGGITVGGSTTLTSAFSGGTGAIDHGVGSVTSGVAKTVTPASTTTYLLTVTNSQGVSALGSLTVSVAPAPVTTITAPANITANATGTASVPSQPGATYLWTLTGGTVTGGSSTSNVVGYTAGASGSVGLSCKVTNAAGTYATGTFTQAIVPAPTISAFTAAASNITTGGSTTLTATFGGGTATVNNGVGTVSSGTPVTVSPASDTTYTLTATNAAGTTATASTLVRAYAQPTTTITAPASAYSNLTGQTASVPAQAGATYAWSITGGTLTSSTTANAVTFTTGAVGTLTLSCTVTNAAGTAATGTKTVTVTSVPTPIATITVSANVTTGLSGYAASVPAMTGATYAWTLTGGTITAGSGTRAITFTPGAVGTLGLQCIVTNSVNVSTTGNASSTVVAMPVGTITAPASVNSGFTGYSASVSSQAGCTYAWTIAGGTPTSATNASALTFNAGGAGTLTLTCMVTNAAGTSVLGTRSVTVNQSPDATLTAPLRITTGSLNLAASVPPQAGSTYAWTLTGGTLTTSSTQNWINFSAPTAGTLSLQCVVTNAQGVAVTGTASIPVEASMDLSGTFIGSGGYYTTILYQAGNTVTGSWTINGTPYTITSATLSGTVLTGSYSKSGGTGTFSLTFPADASSFSGTYAPSTGGSNTIIGTRQTGLNVQISPTSSIMTTGGTQVFTALVGGNVDKGLAWTASGGSVTPAGAYTAPATGGVYTVTATSTVDNTKFTTATVTASDSGFMDVSGTFIGSSGYYTTTLYQLGGTVSGGWTVNGTTYTITSATLSGTVLSGTCTTSAGSGAFSWTFAADGSSFGGTYSPYIGGSNTMAGSRQNGTVKVVINPTSSIMTTGGTQVFTALVGGSYNKGISWSAPGGGTVDANGAFTAPATGGVYTVTATSMADNTKSATATVAASDSGYMDVSGTFIGSGGYYTTTLYQLGGAVSGGWTVNGTPYTITSATLNGTVLSGTCTTNAGSGAFSWTFVADGTSFAGTYSPYIGGSNTMAGSRQNGTVKVVINPISSIMTTGATQVFTALVGGSYNKGISWSAPGGGTVDANGAYTTPATGGVYTVTATSMADNTKSATATVAASDSGYMDVSGLFIGSGGYYTTTLYQLGGAVSGGWTVNGTPYTITSATLSGTVLSGTCATNAGSGTFSWTFAADGTSFAGTYYPYIGPYNTMAGSRQNGTVKVLVAPAASVVPPTWSQNLLVWVGGTYDKRVTWSVQEAGGGTVNTSGTYTAPSTVGTYHVLATSVPAPAASGTATIQVSSAGLQTLPDWIHLAPNTSKTFTAVIRGVPVQATWTIQEGTAGGSITSTGGLYLAPATPGTYHLVATSALDPSVTAKAIVVVDAQIPLSVSIAPGTLELAKGATQTFSATVAGSTNQAVTWSCSAGTITSGGLYTAPTHYGTYTVTARSAADPSISGTATVTVSVSAGTDQAFTYDANGNMLSDGNRTFEWDAENRLTAVTVNGGDTITRSEFDYDGLGRRVQIREYANTGFHGTMVLGSAKRYLWNGVEIAEERLDDALTVSKRFYAQGFVDSDGTNLYYTRDHLGSIRELTDNIQFLRARYDYDPYGRIIKVGGDRDSVFGYTGHFWHASSSLYLSMYRVYDASIGRWLSRDPLQELAGPNIYIYVHGDPIKWVDSLGLDRKPGESWTDCYERVTKKYNEDHTQLTDEWMKKKPEMTFPEAAGLQDDSGDSPNDQTWWTMILSIPSNVKTNYEYHQYAEAQWEHRFDEAKKQLEEEYHKRIQEECDACEKKGKKKKNK